MNKYNLDENDFVCYGLRDRCDYIQSRLIQDGYGKINADTIKQILQYDVENIRAALLEGDDVRIKDLGTFFLQFRNKRIKPEWMYGDFNPNEAQYLPEHNIPKFKFTQPFMDEVKKKTSGNPPRKKIR